MFPTSLALIEDDADYASYLAEHLRELGIQVVHFEQPTHFLATSAAYDHDFYVIDLGLPSIDGVELIKLLRLRTSAGILVVSGRSEPDVFASIVKAGADMYLAKPVNFDQVALAIEAVHRRSGRGRKAEQPWRLDMRAQDLIAPDGTRVNLSETDLTVMLSLARAEEHTVSREALRHALGYAEEAGTTSALNAAIFRLRRRIEKATPLPVPLQAKSRVGYQFRGHLQEL